jgi:ligand-binding SRPBCC domain-containing protein
MPVINLQTYIEAPIQRCFDLSRSIDLHRLGFAHTKEEAVAGVTSGLIGLNQSVTWRATHFCVRQYLTVKIDQFDPPVFFSDSMIKGAFKRFRHDHIFEELGGRCMMKDVFDYESPLGIVGRIADSLFLQTYMTRLLEGRNETIKRVAESDEWLQVLVHSNEIDPTST